MSPRSMVCLVIRIVSHAYTSLDSQQQEYVTDSHYQSHKPTSKCVRFLSVLGHICTLINPMQAWKTDSFLRNVNVDEVSVRRMRSRIRLHHSMTLFSALNSQIYCCRLLIKQFQDSSSPLVKLKLQERIHSRFQNNQVFILHTGLIIIDWTLSTVYTDLSDLAVGADGRAAPLEARSCDEVDTSVPSDLNLSTKESTSLVLPPSLRALLSVGCLEMKKHFRKTTMNTGNRETNTISNPMSDHPNWCASCSPTHSRILPPTQPSVCPPTHPPTHPSVCWSASLPIHPSISLDNLLSKSAPS